MQCLLCGQNNMTLVDHRSWQNSGALKGKVDFFNCLNCDLIFRDPASFLSLSLQKDRYDLHQNSNQDPKYQQYLNGVIEPALPFLKSRNLKTGLDWGAGPGPCLSKNLNNLGFEVFDYDPIYQPKLLVEKVDFIFSTEVFEHFLEPKKEIQKILNHLNDFGVLAGMTSFHQGSAHFFDWWYVRDITHVCFFSEKTFHWLADYFSLETLALQNPVFILGKGRV